MKCVAGLVLTSLSMSPALAEDARQLDAHEHGVGEMNIALEGDQVAIEFHVPGADLVGFEYVPETAEDKAAVDAAVATLARPLDLFVMPEAAGCTVLQASAELHSEEDHGEEHADGHDDHDDHAHDDHGHEEAEAAHAEFHAEYLLTCADPSAISKITFAYFDTFPNALEVEVQMVSDAGATSFQVERDSPVLDLPGML